MAIGAMAGIAVLLENAKEYNLPADLCFGDWRQLDGDRIEKIINWLWKGQTTNKAGGTRHERRGTSIIHPPSSIRYTYAQQLIEYVQNAKEQLHKLTADSPKY